MSATVAFPESSQRTGCAVDGVGGCCIRDLFEALRPIRAYLGLHRPHLLWFFSRDAVEEMRQQLKLDLVSVKPSQVHGYLRIGF